MAASRGIAGAGDRSGAMGAGDWIRDAVWDCRMDMDGQRGDWGWGGGTVNHTTRAQRTNARQDNIWEACAREKMLETIARNGYRVYFAAGMYIVADPFNCPDGFFLTVQAVSQAYYEMLDAGLLKC
jgi:hypothetical protein